ncbi:carbohydrate-binding DOMON domain-containing protein [Sphingomonas jinjuensis]|uniref:Carbohydrate-binding DOMON domain-containing protein n=1 Tax=Sphingomonas jinjuensis TaxID=535907 RepID=A0A840FES2_9SPHN|nr:hypothetical protein [Sphingomonas jinjuensis]MBB4154234.1 carbohydrate-binding DOMON domain-containing protein [Sphingomonas jinjuensis]
MTKSLPFILLSAGAMIAGTAAIADAQTATKTTTKTTTQRAANGQFVKKTTTSGKMVTTKLANGKSVTYDCGKPGNATKAVCKK